MTDTLPLDEGDWWFGELTDDSVHQYVLKNDTVSILFDRAYVSDFGTVHLYSHGHVIATVKVENIPVKIADGLR